MFKFTVTQILAQAGGADVTIGLLKCEFEVAEAGIFAVYGELIGRVR
jgi:hypothetical protein